MPQLTMLDIAKNNGNDKTIGLIEEGLKVCPELARIPGRQVKGTSYTTVRRKTRPSVGFRGANEGVDISKSTFEKVVAQMYILSGIVRVDKAIADADEQGREHLQGVEATGIAQGVLEAVGRQVWYGTSADANGFEGLQNLLGSTTADSGGRVVVSDCTSGSNNTSAYLVRFGENDGLSFDFGSGTTLDMSEFRTETVTENGKSYAAYVADITGWIGMRLASAEAAMRIANIRAENGKSGLSDAIVAEALSYWTGRAPDAIFMSRRAAFLLQKSRSVTLMSGPQGRVSSALGPFAPAPTDVQGIPIIITDALAQTEAFVG